VVEVDHQVERQPPTVPDRTDLWLSLLCRISDAVPAWATWKNVESAFAGTGDVDSLAPPGDWPAVREVFLEWARERGLGPAIVCPHVPQGPHFIAFEPDAPYIVQLDVKVRATFRGSTLVDAWNLLPLTTMDPRGFRCVRPGADGVIRLVSNGIRPGGRENRTGLKVKRVAQLLASDPDGVEAIAGLFGPARQAVIDGANAVAAGAWDRRAMLAVEAWALVRGLAEPRVVVSRLWFAQVPKRRCPVIRLIREDDRRVPNDLSAWLGEVRRGHEVIPLDDPA
jgi:hypothetical protein